MADGGYQRTCTKCQHAWIVPTAIAEERPDLKSIGGQMASLIGGNFADQVALKAHFQQLGAAAKCPQCGATSFSQVKAPDVPDVSRRARPAGRCRVRRRAGAGSSVERPGVRGPDASPIATDRAAGSSGSRRWAPGSLRSTSSIRSSSP